MFVRCEAWVLTVSTKRWWISSIGDSMDHLVIGLYVLSLLACCVSLWLWYELDTHRDYTNTLRIRINELGHELEELKSKRR